MEYISALIAAQREEKPTDEPFNRLIAECELEAQRDYGRMFRIPLEKKPPVREPLTQHESSSGKKARRTKGEPER